jgi:histone H3/H4
MLSQYKSIKSINNLVKNVDNLSLFTKLDNSQDTDSSDEDAVSRKKVKKTSNKDDDAESKDDDAESKDDDAESKDDDAESKDDESNNEEESDYDHSSDEEYDKEISYNEQCTHDNLIYLEEYYGENIDIDPEDAEQVADMAEELDNKLDILLCKYNNACSNRNIASMILNYADDESEDYDSESYTTYDFEDGLDDNDYEITTENIKKYATNLNYYLSKYEQYQDSSWINDDVSFDNMYEDLLNNIDENTLNLEKYIKEYLKENDNNFTEYIKDSMNYYYLRDEQQNTDLIIDKDLVHDICEEILEYEKNDYDISDEAIEILHHISESYIVETFEKANLIAVSQKRRTVNDTDVNIAKRVRT